MNPRSSLLPAGASILTVIAALAAVWAITRSTDAIPDVAPYSPAPTPGASVVQVRIDAGMSPERIAQMLEEAGVIESAAHFRVMASFLGYEGNLQAGDYEFTPDTPVLIALRRIRLGETVENRITVVEGRRLEEIADALAEFGISREVFLAEAFVRNFNYPFLEGLDGNQRLEGYLFPATYPVRSDDTPRSMLEKMLTAFQENLPADVYARANRAGLSLHQVITLASIVEREARVPDERPIIAQVFLSRLQLGIPLEADPTVQYALGFDSTSVRQHGYWKQGLTEADLQYDSPFNTYLHDGPPPGPICSPGADSIEAVLSPADTGYLYFVARPDGSHAFAETFEEHLQNIAELQGQ
jgi:UPF0755 protein